ncbi:MAG: phage major capsid protein, P2 family [Sterolibacterium sp.]|nr:phage major capsid protein, P2 family [Sterolibacterium sp.]
MRRETRLAFNAYLEQLVRLNGVPSVTEKFTVTPSVQQKLESKIQESSAFLGRINIMGVTTQQGDKLGLGVGSTVASTTDTTLADRVPTDPTSLDTTGYNCTQTNYDTAIRYAKLDAWAKFPDFQTRIRDVIIQRQALDRMVIGFNGTSRAATSNRATNPLLQDVNIGWLQKYRTDAAARVMAEGATADSDEVRIGAAAGHDYVNLDALVFDVVASLLEPWYRNDPGLVVILGRDLLHDKYFPLVNQTQAATETLATDIIISQKRVGGLQAVSVPYFPDGSLMITTYDNLSIYYQDGARRRTIKDNAARDQIENFESSNDAYVIEDYGRGCVVENIVQTWTPPA